MTRLLEHLQSRAVWFYSRGMHEPYRFTGRSKSTSKSFEISATHQRRSVSNAQVLEAQHLSFHDSRCVPTTLA
jgi:hypothetical protein